MGWKNPLWKRPSEWIILGKPTKRAARPGKVDAMLAHLLERARVGARVARVSIRSRG